MSLSLSLTIWRSGGSRPPVFSVTSCLMSATVTNDVTATGKVPMGVAMEMVHVTCGTSGGVFSFSVSRLSSRLSSSESSPGSHAARLLTAAFGFFAGSAAGFFFGGAGFFLGGAFFAGAFLGAGFGAEASLRGLPGPLFAGTFFGLAAGFFAAGFFAAGLALVLAMALTFVAFAFGAAPREPRVEAGMFATTNFGSPKKINWLTG
mmetsp:Transcript_11412/g.51766  ORF Transcript_11412/g.51766 Transcript_11412/m.51766 type:complete len:205 (+) Transcript_11412:634-1248(+)